MIANLDQVFKEGEFLYPTMLLGYTLILVDHDLHFLEFVHNVEKDEGFANYAP